MLTSRLIHDAFKVVKCVQHLQSQLVLVCVISALAPILSPSLPLSLSLFLSQYIPILPLSLSVCLSVWTWPLNRLTSACTNHTHLHPLIEPAGWEQLETDLKGFLHSSHLRASLVFFTLQYFFFSLQLLQLSLQVFYALEGLTAGREQERKGGKEGEREGEREWGIVGNQTGLL